MQRISGRPSPVAAFLARRWRLALVNAARTKPGAVGASGWAVDLSMKPVKAIFGAGGFCHCDKAGLPNVANVASMLVLQVLIPT